MLGETCAVALPLVALGDAFGLPVGFVAVAFVPLAWGLWRALTLAFVLTSEGAVVRNPWRTYRVPWTEVVEITDAAVSSVNWAICPALRLRGRRRPLPVCALATWGKGGEAKLSYLFRLWAVRYRVPVRPGYLPVASRL